MNNINFNPQMSEEAFEELLNVMEKSFASLKILDCEYKLTKSASLSQLQTLCKSQEFLFTKSYQPGSCKNLVKDHKWEEYFNANSITRQVKDSHKQVKLNGNELHNPRKENSSLTESDVARNSELIEKIKMNEEKPEYMEVEESTNVKPLYSRISPKKSYPSFFPIQTKPSSAFSSGTPSIVFPESSLSRSSRSEITNVPNSPEKEPSIFNVSRSFGQFTFKEDESEDSKEILHTEKPDVEIKNSASKETNDVKQEPKRGKKRLRPLMQERKKGPIYSCSCWQIIFFLLLPVAVVLISAMFHQQDTSSVFFNPTFNFTNVTKNLPKLVHGQTQSIKDLITFLEFDESKFKVVALVGGTGVGKSHVANIIKDSLPNDYYTFEYFPPVYNKIGQAYSKLSICQCNVIILENLGTEDISDAAFFSHSLQNRASNLCVLIVALFNTQVTDNYLRRSLDLKGSVKSIEDGFEKEGVKVKSISFEPLREESIVKCIKDAIIESNVEVSEEDIDRIKEHLLIANSGCKGAYSKVQLFGKVTD